MNQTKCHFKCWKELQSNFKKEDRYFLDQKEQNTLVSYLQAFFAFVATLVTIMTNHITRIKSRCRPSERRRGGAAQRTIPCNMTWLATDIAHRTIDTISCQMSRLTTIIARFLVGAVHSKMSWSITIVAQPCFGNPSFLHNTTLG